MPERPLQFVDRMFRRCFKTLLICLWVAAILQACGGASSDSESNGVSMTLGIGGPAPEDVFDLPDDNHAMVYGPFACPEASGSHQKHDLLAQVTVYLTQSSHHGGGVVYLGNPNYRIDVFTLSGETFSADQIDWQTYPMLVLGDTTAPDGSLNPDAIMPVPVGGSAVVTPAQWHLQSNGALATFTFNVHRVPADRYKVGFSFRDTSGNVHCLSEPPTFMLSAQQSIAPGTNDGSGSSIADGGTPVAD